MHISWALRITIIWGIVLCAKPVLRAADPLLIGSVIAATTDRGVSFVDIGTGRTWSKDLTSEGYTLRGWMPDGCHVLITQPTTDNRTLRYFTLSINALEIREFPLQGHPIFSPSGTHIAYFNERDGLTRLDYVELQPNFNLSNPITIVERPYGQLRRDGTLWVTEDTLIYEAETSRFLWHRLNRSTEALSPIVFPTIPRFYSTARSPDGLTLAVFANLREYYEAIDPRVTELTESEIEEAKDERPAEPGIELFDLLGVGSTVHIPVDNTFLVQVVWSPDSSRLATVSDPTNDDPAIHVYDRSSAMLTRVGDTYFEGDIYLRPSWSIDSRWLSYRVRGGFVAEDVETGQEIAVPLDVEFYSLFWSPRLNYDDYACP